MKLDKIRIVNVTNGRTRDIVPELWAKFRPDKDGDTKEGGWKEVQHVSDEEKVEAIKRFDEIMKSKQASVVTQQPAQTAQPEKKNPVVESAVTEESNEFDDITGNPIELQTEPEEVVEPVVKKRRTKKS